MAAPAADIVVDPALVDVQWHWDSFLDQADINSFDVPDPGGLQILSRETLATAPRGGINLHASLLPKYRGAAPINWAIYHGESTTGVTVIHMSPQLDAGPCLARRSVDIGVITTPPGAAQKVCEQMVDSGLRAILNFAPVRVKAAEDVLVKTVDLKVHLEELCFFLAHASAG